MRKVLVCALLVAFTFAGLLSAATESEIDAALKDAVKRRDTKEGLEYEKKLMLGGPIGKAMVQAMHACGKGKIDLRTPVVIFIAADGRVERVLTESTPYGKCVAKHFKLPARLPQPPGSKPWSIAAMVMYEHPRPNAKPDKLTRVDATKFERYESINAPLTAKARKSYPAAKARFLKGLPPEHTFYVRARLRDPNQNIEDVFVRVKSIENGRIRGVIESDLAVVKKFKTGQTFIVPESDILDWTIVRPDGSEEGNLIGNYHDAHPEEFQ